MRARSITFLLMALGLMLFLVPAAPGFASNSSGGGYYYSYADNSPQFTYVTGYYRRPYYRHHRPYYKSYRYYPYYRSYRSYPYYPYYRPYRPYVAYPYPYYSPFVFPGFSFFFRF